MSYNIWSVYNYVLGVNVICILSFPQSLCMPSFINSLMNFFVVVITFWEFYKLVASSMVACDKLNHNLYSYNTRLSQLCAPHRIKNPFCGHLHDLFNLLHIREVWHWNIFRSYPMLIIQAKCQYERALWLRAAPKCDPIHVWVFCGC